MMNTVSEEPVIPQSEATKLTDTIFAHEKSAHAQMDGDAIRTVNYNAGKRSANDRNFGGRGAFANSNNDSYNWRNRQGQATRENQQDAHSSSNKPSGGYGARAGDGNYGTRGGLGGQASGNRGFRGGRYGQSNGPSTRTPPWTLNNSGSLGGGVFPPSASSGSTGYSTRGLPNRSNHVSSRASGLMSGGNSGGRRDRGDERGGRPGVSDGTWATRDGVRPSYEREDEIFKSTKDKTTGINFDSYDAIEVEVSGRDTETLKPLTSFRTAAEMPAELTANILRVRYDKPTPVQKYAIPILLNDRDLMACAQTGSGKTAAFLFPIIIKMVRSGPPPSVQGVNYVARPVALVLSPTRELTCQIFEESRKFAFATGIKTVVIFGGEDTRMQLAGLSRGCDICIATPGRLNDILERGRISLSQVRYLVLDEADRMLDMGFAPQIHQIVETKDLPSSTEGRQTAMFSATFPREIQQLASAFLINYVYLTVGRVGSTNEFITQKLIYAEEAEKPKRLLQLLREANGRVLVFVETKKKADMVEDYLIRQELQATSIHGDRTQAERNRALELFKKGTCPILVATDVAARGLDIHSITWVINLDLPHNIEDYVHRIGRTGRAGNAGLATSFVNEQNRPILRELHRLLEEANQEVPSWFFDLTRACSSSTTRFGSNRYGGGRGGNRSNFGGVDYRSMGNDGGRRTFNAGNNSPRGGGGQGGMGGFSRQQYNNNPNMGGGVRTDGVRGGVPHNQGGDDCW